VTTAAGGSPTSAAVHANHRPRLADAETVIQFPCQPMDKYQAKTKQNKKTTTTQLWLLNKKSILWLCTSCSPASYITEQDYSKTCDMSKVAKFQRHPHYRV
jgi:hypothetical protein